METSVKYTMKIKSSNKDYELIRHICHLRYDSSRFPAVEYNDKYKIIEVDYYSGSGIYRAIEDARIFKELLKDENGMEFEINGVEDSDYGNFNLFQIIYKDKDAVIRQVPFNIDEDNMDCCDLVFSISGKLKYFENREDLMETIEDLGGICSNAVSKNTDYLITNDTDDNSKKILKAKELGIGILTELEFIKKIGYEYEFDIDEDELGDVTDYDYYEQEARKELMNTKFENIDNCYCVWEIKPVGKELIDSLKKQIAIYKQRIDK